MSLDNAAFNASSSLQASQNILALDLQNDSCLYSLILTSIDVFFRAVGDFWVHLPGPRLSLFLLLFVVTTVVRARSDSCGLRNRLTSFVAIC